MKIYKYISCLLLTVSSFSCDSYLDIAPDNVATIEYAFRNRVGVEKFLATCYSYIPVIGSVTSDPAIMGSDEFWCYDDPTIASSIKYHAWYLLKGLQNSNSPYINNWDGANSGSSIFKGISNCNVFIDNIYIVGNQMSDAEKNQWIAEVKFLKAYYHYYLMKMYGPIPLMKKNISIEADIDEVRVYRDTWDDCVNYVVQLIDEAVPYLPLKIEDEALDMGRITQPIALAIKAEMLTTSASPLFNGNEEYKDLVDSRGVHLFPQTYDESKWEKAAQACKNAIDTCLLAGHDLYQFNGAYQLSDTTKLLNTLRCVYSDRFNKEIIWASTKNSAFQSYCMPYFTKQMASQVPWYSLLAPSFKMTELFYSNHGVPIKEDTSYDYENRYKVSTAPVSHFYYLQKGYKTANLNINREARYYANLGFDGSWWWGNGRFNDVGTSPSNNAAWPIKMKCGDPSGKNGSIRYSASGYWAKKPCHMLSTCTSNGKASLYRYGSPIIRLADLYLLYVETLNEVKPQPDNEVYAYLDKVRHRAGLKGVVESWKAFSKYPNKPLTKAGLREIIHQERLIELCFESKRFWDLRRWKEAYSTIPGPVKSWNLEGSTVEDYYHVKTIDNLSFTTKDYLWPISTHSIRVNPNLVQNPFWE